DHGHLDQGGHGGMEPSVMRIPIVLWGAGAIRGAQGGRGRDVGPTIASLLGIGPLADATGRPLVRGDAVTSREGAPARAAVSSAGNAHYDVPVAIPVAVVALLAFGATSDVRIRRLLTAPTYAVVFAMLLFVSHTLSFSVTNDGARFGARLVALS